MWVAWTKQRPECTTFSAHIELRVCFVKRAPSGALRQPGQPSTSAAIHLRNLPWQFCRSQHGWCGTRSKWHQPPWGTFLRHHLVHGCHHARLSVSSIALSSLNEWMASAVRYEDTIPCMVVVGHTWVQTHKVHKWNTTIWHMQQGLPSFAICLYGLHLYEKRHHYVDQAASKNTSTHILDTEVWALSY